VPSVVLVIAVGVQLLKSPITATDVLPGAYKLNITDLPELINVTPSPAPEGIVVDVTVVVFPVSFPELGDFLHEVKLISSIPNVLIHNEIYLQFLIGFK
jgi:hypothetical protein